jgi:hypothetical protein
MLTALALAACDNAKARPITEHLLSAERHDVELSIYCSAPTNPIERWNRGAVAATVLSCA